MSDELPPLFHYSATPLGELHPLVTQTPREGGAWSFIDKPQGLWLSVDGDDGWEEWSRGADFNLDRLVCKTRVYLKENARLLRLKSPHEIEEFNGLYGVPSAYPGIMDTGINWARVAEKYHGIIIAPYQWSLRMGLLWYYTWDCSSGCVWDTTIIERLEPCSPLSDETEHKQETPND